MVDFLAFWWVIDMLIFLKLSLKVQIFNSCYTQKENNSHMHLVSLCLRISKGLSLRVFDEVKLYRNLGLIFIASCWHLVSLMFIFKCFSNILENMLIQPNFSIFIFYQILLCGSRAKDEFRRDLEVKTWRI